MYRTLLQVVFGVAMAGCTTSTTVVSSYQYTLDYDGVMKEASDGFDEPVIILEGKTNHATVSTDEKQRQCASYKPIPTPKPVQVDLNLIKSLKSADQVNEVLIKNISVLNEQMREHARAQAIHYRSWQKKCHGTK